MTDAIENQVNTAALQEAADAAYLQEAVAEFESEREAKSFSGRHPELGKMVNCGVCGRRHRSAHVCVPVYARQKIYDPETGQDTLGGELVASDKTVKGVYGAARVKGRRILRHRNATGLQVLERADRLYREEYLSFIKANTEKERDELGKRALIQAIREIKAERRAHRRKLYKITRRSRQINHGNR